MAVMQLRGKSIWFIDEEGNQFFTSINFTQGLINGRSKQGFVLLSRAPDKVAKGRFKESPLWDPKGIYKGGASKTLTTTNDAISVKKKKETEIKDGFQDKSVW